MEISVTKSSISFLLLYLVALSAFQFRFCSSSFSPIFFPNRTVSPLAPTERNRGSNIILRLSGEVYEAGYFNASFDIGQPARRFDLAIDTGSDLTWVLCDETLGKTVDQHYKPKKENILRCDDPFCEPYRKGRSCRRPDDRCIYEFSYADSCKASGFLVSDYFTLRLTNGTVVSHRMVFGCDTIASQKRKRCPTKDEEERTSNGMVGLTDMKISILSQLRGAGIIKNVVGHCLGAKGGGFMFLGDVPAVPKSSGITWVPRNPNPKSLENFYSPEPPKLLYDGEQFAKDLQLNFDSGATYNYLIQPLFKKVFDQIEEDLKKKHLTKIKLGPEDNTAFETCWKRVRPFQSFREVNRYFKPMLLSFPKNKQLQIPPEAYLIIARDGSVCLGIFSGKGNTVGDVSMQDRMMIFDNERKQIGWVSVNCAKIPNS